uniref:Ground-like domain-containing protein n=1 Tax=Rhabditophanes sp. KR3021 TaxID=114890 RepID=A0AC35TJ65_9BILA
MKFTIAALTILLVATEITPLFFGGGGGCQSSCQSPCGRKKREILEPQVVTDENAICPQSNWKSIIEENIGSDVRATEYAIQSSLFKHFETQFFVTCKPKSETPLTFTANGHAYCGHGDPAIFCVVIAIIG